MNTTERVQQLEQALREIRRFNSSGLTRGMQARIDALLSRPEQACTFCGGRGFIGWDDKARREANGDKWGRCLHCRPYRGEQTEQSEREACFCHTGNASSLHPCPVHPIEIEMDVTPAEQVEQSEREAFEDWYPLGCPGAGVTAKLSAQAGFRAGAAWQATRPTPAQTEQQSTLWARQCDLDEPGPAIFVAREQVEESGYVVPFYATACTPAPQEQNGWISVEDRLPEVAEGEQLQVAVCVQRADGKRYVFAAQYLNQYPLYSEDDENADEDGMLLSTGWYDVKEHYEYDEAYSPLIAADSGDTITHWQPLPAAPALPQGGRDE